MGTTTGTTWNYRRYGGATDPIHKSHLNDITGDYGCPTRFRYQMDARAAAGGMAYDVSRPVRGDAACGTAAHETIARVLSSDVTRPRVLAGPGAVPSDQIARAFDEELARETSGRRVEWYDRDPFTVRADCVTMICGLLDGLHKYVAEVVLVEPAFIVRLGSYWLSGHIDLVYRPRADPTALAMADWKTGVRRPIPVVIDHSWEAGVYSVACRDGWFLRREYLRARDDLATRGTWTVTCGPHAVTHPSKYIAERECAERVLSSTAVAWEARPRDAMALVDHIAATVGHVARVVDDTAVAGEVVTLDGFGQFPSEIYHVHLQDYLPYKRAGKKEVHRPEDLAWYRRDTAGSVRFKVGDMRGPAWLPVRMTATDVPRVAYRVKNVVGMIRMGRFIDQIGERCNRCPYAGDCLNGGYAVAGDDRRDIERTLSAADVTDAGELAIED